MGELITKFQNIKKIMSKYLEYLTDSFLHNNKLRKYTSKLKIKIPKHDYFLRQVIFAKNQIKP